MVTRYEDGLLVSRPVEDVRAGDLLMVKGGEVVQVDGQLVGNAVLDDSAFDGRVSTDGSRPGGLGELRRGQRWFGVRSARHRNR